MKAGRCPAFTAIILNVLFQIILDDGNDRLRQFIDIVQRFYKVFGSHLIFIESFDILLSAVEMQAANRLAVIVVEENTEVGDRIAVYDAIQIDDIAKDRPDDI